MCGSDLHLQLPPTRPGDRRRPVGGRCRGGGHRRGSWCGAPRA